MNTYWSTHIVFLNANLKLCLTKTSRTLYHEYQLIMFKLYLLFLPLIYRRRSVGGRPTGLASHRTRWFCPKQFAWPRTAFPCSFFSLERKRGHLKNISSCWKFAPSSLGWKRVPSTFLFLHRFEFQSSSSSQKSWDRASSPLVWPLCSSHESLVVFGSDQVKYKVFSKSGYFFDESNSD